MADEFSMQDVLRYCEGLPLRQFAEGEVLIAEGPASNCLYILVSGEAEVLRGDTQVAEINAPGAVFGEMSALLGIHHTATVRVVKLLFMTASFCLVRSLAGPALPMQGAVPGRVSTSGPRTVRPVTACTGWGPPERAMDPRECRPEDASPGPLS